jgi:hypothetical protein
MTSRRRAAAARWSDESKAGIHRIESSPQSSSENGPRTPQLVSRWDRRSSRERSVEASAPEGCPAPWKGQTGYRDQGLRHPACNGAIPRPCQAVGVAAFAC